MTDTGGLSADARLEIEVIPKVLNRAPFWKPNVSVSPSKSQEKKVSMQVRSKGNEIGAASINKKSDSKQKKNPEGEET